ncbi:MAG: sulfatase-like hydrolase/transferase, partial [Planctomycetaceae bacterium]|nr:sulfatase-like hydrolase/transferase [Planctomycetaceae bacterium]
YREWVLPRMIEKGVMPAGTKMTPINPLPEDIAVANDDVRPWNTLSAEEKELFSKMAEVYAGFSEYTDAQVGRIIDYLEQTGQLENTIVFYCADNGASGEGSPNGSVNENKFFNGYPDELSENMKYLNTLGSPDTYNHYPTGWAVAFSTPFQMFKRYSQFAGGTCDPMVISWPKGIKAKGEVRNQYHHATDVAATVLDVAGLEMPQEYNGVKQYPLNGVSM